MSNELKPCPCCGGEAILERHSHREFSPDFSVRCRECRVCTTTYKNATMAVETWNRRTPQDHTVVANKKVDDNPPLTLEELRGMVGKSVYVMFHIKPLKSLKRGVWINWASSDLRFSTMENFENQLKLKDYGESWIAYRYKPEEDEKNEKTH